MKQNVLFILVDCLRADKCYGNNRTCKTPNIDSLIKKGTFFSKTIATTTTTTPSVASIFTGLYTFGHGIRSLSGYKINNNIQTLAEVFKNNGYNTYAEVTGPLHPCTGLAKGFDYYNHRSTKKYFVEKWGDDLINKLENGYFKEPWFIYIHAWELHYRRRISKGFNNNKFGKNRYERALSSLDAKLGELFKKINFDNTTVIIHGDHGEKIINNMSLEYLHDVKQIMKSVIEFTRYVTMGVFRKIFKFFGGKYEDLPDFAKHKPKIKKPFPFKLFGHATHIYDSAVIIPLIISGSNGQFSKNRFISTQVRQIDIFPTLMDIFELDYNKENKIHGQSLLPLIKGENLDIPPAYCEACGVILGAKSYWKVGLRTPKYKFIYRPYHSNKHEELYDLEKDPFESKNIVKFKPQIVNALKKQLMDIRKDDLKEIKLVGQKMTKEEDKLLTERLRELGYL